MPTWALGGVIPTQLGYMPDVFVRVGARDMFGPRLQESQGSRGPQCPASAPTSSQLSGICFRGARGSLPAQWVLCPS